MSNQMEAWEGEEGAPVPSDTFAAPLSGTANQVEWAERIRRQVNAEFDRVAASFRSVARKQSSDKRADTEKILAILEDNRAAAMSKLEAGYFIRDWQEISDQVRQMIGRDSRYQAIQVEERLGCDPSNT